jgi:hypothetical protein
MKIIGSLTQERSKTFHEHTKNATFDPIVDEEYG